MIFVAPRNDKDINGIIHQYRDKLYMYVDSSSNFSNTTSAQNLILKDPQNDFFAVGDSPNVSIYFPKSPIRIISYSIQTSLYATNSYFPRCWELYGQIRDQWNIISIVTESGLNGKGLIKVFQIYGDAVFIPYSAFILKMTCKTYNKFSDNMNLILYSIDFFGLVTTQKKSIYYKQFSFQKLRLYLFINLFSS